MSSLELVIKDLEFENEKIIIQTQEEIAILEGMQNDLHNKSAENEKLEEGINNYNSNVKVLHSQFKQNQEITESLKTASSLLNRHVVDLRNTLKLKCQETEREREELEKIADKYKSKWLCYEEEYEKRPLAKEIRIFKLQAAKLDAEEAELNDCKKKMEVTIQDYENLKGSIEFLSDFFFFLSLDPAKSFEKRCKEEAITSIIHLAQLSIKAMSLNIQIPKIMQEKTELNTKIHALTDAIKSKKVEEDIKKEALLQKKIPDEKPICQLPQVTIDINKKSEYDLLSCQPKQPQQEQKLRVNLLQSLNSYGMRIGPSKIQLPSFGTSRQSLPNQVCLPKMPQLPKFPSFHKHSIKNLANFNLTKSGHVASGTPQLEGEKKDVPHLKRLEPQNSLGHQLFVKESSTHLPIGNFIAPLDQSTDEFFGLEQPMDVEGDKVTRSDSPCSKFSFSPNQHAEHLKMIKQSPGDAFVRTGRSMFSHNNLPYLNQDCADINKELLQSRESNSSYHLNESSSKLTFTDNEIAAEASYANNSANFSFNRFSLSSPGIHFSTSSERNPLTLTNANSTSNFTLNSHSIPEPTFNFGVVDNNKDAESSTFNFGVSYRSCDQSSVKFSNFPSAELGCSIFNFGNTLPENAGDSPFNFSMVPNDEKAPIKDGFDFTFGGTPQVISSSNFSFNF